MLSSDNPLLLLVPTLLCSTLANCSIGLSTGELPFSHFSSAPPPGYYSISNAIVETYFADHQDSKLFTLRLNNQLVTVTSSSSFRPNHLSHFGSGTAFSDGQTIFITNWSSNKVRAYPNNSSLPYSPPTPPRFYPLKMNPTKGFFKFIQVLGEDTSSSYKQFQPLSSSLQPSSSSSFPIKSFYSYNSIFTDVLISNNSILSGTSFRASGGFACFESVDTDPLTGYRSYNDLPVYPTPSNNSFSGNFIFVFCKDF